MGEQTTFLAGAAEAATSTAAAPAEQSTAAETTPPPQAATGQTVATPGTAPAAPADAAPVTSGQAEATKPAPVEVKVPKGVELDGGLLEAIKAGDPQKVVDAYAAVEEQSRAAWDAQSRTWAKEVETDKELGGTNLDQTRAYLAKAMTKYGTPELAAELKELGLDNNPRLVRFVARVGKAMAEDTVAGTTSPTNGAGPKDYRSWFPGQDLNP